jgi:hypothetical protein
MSRSHGLLGRLRFLLAALIFVAATTISYQPPVRAETGSSPEEEALAEALATGVPVQVMANITTTTDVWAQPDGTSLIVDIAAGPVREPDPENPGEWVPIDTTLEDTGDSIQPKVADVELSFSDGGTDPLATMAVNEGVFGLGWSDPLPPPVLEANTAHLRLGPARR